MRMRLILTVFRNLRPSLAIIAGPLILAFAAPPALGDATSSRREALKAMFPASEKVRKVTRSLDDEAAQRVAKALGRPTLRQREFVFYAGETAGKTDGYAIILNEKGKFRPITFLVGIDPKGKVKMVEILQYREPIGGEIRHPRFRRQFKGKGASDPIGLRKDIKNISGATISCRAICAGVKKSVVLVKEIFLKTPEENGKPPSPREGPAEPEGPERSKDPEKSKVPPKEQRDSKEGATPAELTGDR